MGLSNAQISQLGNINSKADLIQALRGTTVKADAIANGIVNGNIKVNLLGDEMFGKAYSLYGGEGAAPQAFALENQIYMRRASASIFSDTVHEGTHALDAIQKFPGSNWMWESKAYFYERQFQQATGRAVDFPTNRSMWDHVYKNYNP